jgi:hypothetical protein
VTTSLPTGSGPPVACVVTVTDPAPPTSVTEPIDTPPNPLKLTDPVGVAPPWLLTVATQVACSPAVAGLGEQLTVVEVGIGEGGGGGVGVGGAGGDCTVIETTLLFNSLPPFGPFTAKVALTVLLDPVTEAVAWR